MATRPPRPHRRSAIPRAGSARASLAVGKRAVKQRKASEQEKPAASRVNTSIPETPDASPHRTIHPIGSDKWRSFNMANRAFNIATPAAAIEAYDVALLKDPKNDLAYCRRGICFARLKQYENAMGDFDSAIAFNKQEYTSYAGRGAVYVIMKKPEKALDDFQRVVELLEGTEDLEQLKHKREAMVNVGRIQYELKEFEKALMLFSEIIRADRAINKSLEEQDGFPYLMKGYCYMEKADFNHDMAIENFTGAIKRSPDMHQAFCARGNAYLEERRIYDALDDFLYARELQPNNSLYHLRVGNAQMMTGDAASAITTYHQCLKLPKIGKKRKEVLFRNLGIALMSEGKYKRASHRFDAAIKKYGGGLDATLKTMRRVANMKTNASPLWKGIFTENEGTMAKKGSFEKLQVERRHGTTEAGRRASHVSNLVAEQEEVEDSRLSRGETSSDDETSEKSSESAISDSTSASGGSEESGSEESSSEESDDESSSENETDDDDESESGDGSSEQTDSEHDNQG